MNNTINKGFECSVNSHKAQRGYTLIEILVSMAVFLVIILPLLSYSSKLVFSTKARDLQTAYSLLKGECDIIYKNHVLPQEKREVKIGDIVYTIVCDYERDSVLTSWVLYVEKKKNIIAQIKGLAYIPEADIEKNE